MFKSKILPMLISIVIAFCLWAYVITFVSSEREETFYDIPVSFQGEALLEDRNLMVVSQERPAVSLTLYGNRRELNKLDSTNITIVADLSKIGEAGIHSLDYNVYYPGDIPRSAFSVQSQYPNMVKVEVERRVTKDVPVNVIYEGSVQTDYIADKENIELDNPYVNISGPASVVDQITQAMITVNLEDKSESFIESYRFTLSNAQGEPVDAKMVEANIAEVSVTLYIKRVKEIKLVVDVVAGGGATEGTSQITIDPAVIKIAGNETALEDIEEINLGTINLGDLLKDTKLPFVINIPPEFENLSGRTTATVEVKFPDLVTTSIPVTTFNALNVPDGLEVEFITQELPVNVRGSKELIQKMTAENITVSVDFSNAVAGNYTLKAIITMGEGYTSVGAMGSYSVSATVKEVEEDEALTK